MGDTTVTVLMRGSKKVIKKTPWRQFFTNEQTASDYIKEHITHRLKQAQQRVDRLTQILTAGEVSIEEIPPHGKLYDQSIKLK